MGEELPEQAVTLDEKSKAADAAPQNGKLQLGVADRLSNATPCRGAALLPARAEGRSQRDRGAGGVGLFQSARERQQKAMRKTASSWSRSFPAARKRAKRCASSPRCRTPVPGPDRSADPKAPAGGEGYDLAAEPRPMPR